MALASKSSQSLLLKIALFATGLSGIVAEYILSTLASYFIGNATVQWTITVSVMLFSMGLGARLSQKINQHLIFSFIIIEFLLSVIIAFSAMLTYLTSHILELRVLIIYGFCIVIGTMIGMEIPLVVRLNQSFETLKVNIASVLEKDYFGALLGGFLYAFLLLPYLGMTYTPFLLGSINFFVALFLFIKLRDHIAQHKKQLLFFLAVLIFFLIGLGVFFTKDIFFYGEQNKYKDKIVYLEQSKYQKIVLTQWKDYYWFYINGNEQFSTVDEHLYHEPFVHPLMLSHHNPKKILILGGGDGLAAKEVLKHKKVEKITLVDLDPMITSLFSSHPILLNINKRSLLDDKINIVNQDALKFLEENTHRYDIIFLDLPDPKNIDINKLYSLEFYKLCYLRLNGDGVMITQAGSPIFASKAFNCINKTLQKAKFSTLPLHNHLITLGEWGWIMASKSPISPKALKEKIQNVAIGKLNTRWLNQEGLKLITSFGKTLSEDEPVETNTLFNPILYQYYLDGLWKLY